MSERVIRVCDVCQRDITAGKEPAYLTLTFRWESSAVSRFNQASVDVCRDCGSQSLNAIHQKIYTPGTEAAE